MSFASETELFARPEALFRVPVGLASPLWSLFAGAAMTGTAWWWMTQWTRPQNLEAMVAPAGIAEAAASTPIVAAAVEPVTEALLAATPAAEPVGGESAPMSPVLQVIAPLVDPDGPGLAPAEAALEDEAPKPKKKPGEPKPA